MLKEQFFSILKEFSELTGADLSPDEQTGAVVFIVDDDLYGTEQHQPYAFGFRER